jgi:neutral ceramidase
MRGAIKEPPVQREARSFTRAQREKGSPQTLAHPWREVRAEPAGLRAGAACLDITPPLGTRMPGYFHERRATAVHDPLFVRSFALEREGAGIAVAVCDLIGVKRAALDRAKARIVETVGLSPERVLICCTHTHTGAETGEDAYTEFLIGRIADAVRLAWERREPAEVGWGRATEERLVFNRRYRMRDGTVLTNPGIGNPDVIEPVGPIDPEVGVLCLRRVVGRPNPAASRRDVGAERGSGEGCGGETIGLLANYSLHYVGIPEDGFAISADYFGYFGSMIQRMRGEAFIAALSNGACGDVNNIDVLGQSRPKNDHYQHTERVAARVAEAVFWAWNEMSFAADVPLGAAMTEVALPRRPLPSAADRDRAREIEAAIAVGQRVTMGDRAFAARVLRQMEDAPAEVATWVQALRVGDLALVSAPGELLVELGLEIKRRSPFGLTLILELANDSVGYLPTCRAYEEGAYEPEASLFAPGVGEQIVGASLHLLDRLHRA